jgi:hypothetical protein
MDQHFCLPASPRGLLEPDAVKVARPVLRGAERSNALGLPGGKCRIGVLTISTLFYFTPSVAHVRESPRDTQCAPFPEVAERAPSYERMATERTSTIRASPCGT